MKLFKAAMIKKPSDIDAIIKGDRFHWLNEAFEKFHFEDLENQTVLIDDEHGNPIERDSSTFFRDHVPFDMITVELPRYEDYDLERSAVVGVAFQCIGDPDGIVWIIVRDDIKEYRYS